MVKRIIGVIICCAVCIGAGYIWGCSGRADEDRGQPDELTGHITGAAADVDIVAGGLEQLAFNIATGIRGIEDCIGYSTDTVDSVEKVRVLISEMENQYYSGQRWILYLNDVIDYLNGTIDEMPEVPEPYNWQDAYYEQWDSNYGLQP